jgi:nitrite reductase/ring-hydroxylating ferredoxin subunit
MSLWKRVARVDECPAGQAIEVVVDDQMVALFNVDGTFHALDGVCPHQGGPLGHGQLDGCVVTCPWHGWQFDVRSGKNRLSENIIQPSFPCKVEAGHVYIRLA